MNKKATLALLVVLIALCAGYWLMLRLEDRGVEKAVQAKRVFDFEPDQIYTAELQREGELLASASRTQGKPWAFVKPNPTIEANQAIWNRVAVAFAGLTNERTIESKAADLAKYGLDKPALKIGVTKPDGSQIHLAFGAIDATQAYRYVLADDGTVFLIVLKAFQELDRPLAYLRNPYVVTIGDKGITKLEYSRFWAAKPGAPVPDDPDSKSPKVGEESVVVTVEKGDDGKWRLTTPIKADANQDTITELVKQVQFAVGRDYVEEPKALADYGLEPPKARISVYSSPGSEPQTLYFGTFEAGGNANAKSGADTAVKGVFAKNAARPAVFIIDANLNALLPKTPDAFRERRLLTRPATDLTAIHYKALEADVVLNNDPEKGWYMLGSEMTPGNQQAVSNFIATLKGIEGRSFPGDAKPEFGLDKPIIELDLTFGKDQPPASIRVGAQMADTQQSYATQDNGVVTLLNAIDVAALTRKPFDFTDRGLLRFAKTLAFRLEITFEGTQYIFERMRGQWHLKEPQDRSLGSPGDVATLVAILSSCTAVGIDSEAVPQDLAPFGLDKPIAIIKGATLKRDGSGTEEPFGPITVGNPTSDDSHVRYATTNMRPGIFRIQQSIIDEVRETLKSIR